MRIWRANKDEALEYRDQDGTGKLLGSVFRSAIEDNGIVQNGVTGICYDEYPNVWKHAKFFETAKEAKAYVENLLKLQRVL